MFVRRADRRVLGDVIRFRITEFLARRRGDAKPGGKRNVDLAAPTSGETSTPSSIAVVLSCSL